MPPPQASADSSAPEALGSPVVPMDVQDEASAALGGEPADPEGFRCPVVPTVEQKVEFTHPVSDIRSDPVRHARMRAARARDTRKGWREPTRGASQLLARRAQESWDGIVASFVTWCDAVNFDIKPTPGFICSDKGNLYLYVGGLEWRGASAEEAYAFSEENRANLRTVIDLQEALEARRETVGDEMRKQAAIQSMFQHINAQLPPVSAEVADAAGADRGQLLGGPLFARVQVLGHGQELTQAIVGDLLLGSTEVCVACTHDPVVLETQVTGVLSRLRSQGVGLSGATGGPQNLTGGFSTPAVELSDTATTPDEMVAPFAMACFAPNASVDW